MDEKFKLVSGNLYGEMVHIRDINRYVSLEKDIDEIYCTPEFIEWLSIKYPRAIRYVPIDKLSAETRKSVYEKLENNEKILFVGKGKMDDMLNIEMAKELIAYTRGYAWDFFRKLKELDVMDQEIADKIFALNSRNIEYIPERLITMEMIKTALQKDGRLIEVLPPKFQTFEIQKLALSKSYKTLSAIPEEFMTDEIIKYALSLNGDALNYVPKDKRTLEFCELALAGNVSCFRAIPDEFKTLDICLNVLSKKPKSFRYVPVHMITEDFMREIYNLHIIIPGDLLGYANECVKKNNLMKNAVIGDNGKVELPRIKLPEDVSSITIDSLEMYFSSGGLDWLKKNGVNNFEDLVNIVNQPDILVNIKNKSVREEIFGTTSLLKCKYLSEDPEIDINDEEIQFEEINNRVGLSIRAYTSLVRSGMGCESLKEFFEEVSSPNFSKNLSHLRNVGPKLLREIELKLRIITEFYSNKKTNNSTSPEIIDSNLSPSNETLESLNNELKRLRAQSAAIDAQIDAVLAKIQEKMMAESKGGIKR